MSYDVVFLRRGPGQSWEDALEAWTQRQESDEPPGPLSQVERAQWRRVIEGARAILPGGDGGVGESSAGFNDDQSGIELHYSGGDAQVTVPYRCDGEDAVSVMQKVYALARLVETETGLEGYDPQLDEPVADAPPQRARGSMDTTSRRFRDIVEGGGGSGGAVGRGSVGGDERASVQPGLDVPTARPVPRDRPWWRFWA